MAASTQKQALSALLFLYRDVLKTPLDLPIDAVRAKKPKRVPTVLTKEEALNVIERLSGTPRLRAKLLYGGGLRLMECLCLRVKDLDFAQRQIIVRDGKGMEDRITMLPESLIIPLQEHLAHVKRIYVQDVAQKVARSIYRVRWNVRIRMQAGSGSGNMSFLPSACHKTHAWGSFAATT